MSARPIEVVLEGEVLAALALPLLRALVADGRFQPVVTAGREVRSLLRSATGDALRPKPASRPIGRPVVLDLRPGANGRRRRDHRPLDLPDGPRSQPFWWQCFRAAEEAGLEGLVPPPAPANDRPVRLRHAGQPSMLMFEANAVWSPGEVRLLTTNLARLHSGRVVRGPSAGRFGPATLTALRAAAMVVTTRTDVLAWAPAVGTPCVAVLELQQEPLFYRPAWGPVTLISSLEPIGEPVPVGEVVAAVEDLARAPEVDASRLVLITDRQDSEVVS